MQGKRTPTLMKGTPERAGAHRGPVQRGPTATWERGWGAGEWGGGKATLVCAVYAMKRSLSHAQPGQLCEGRSERGDG